MIEGARTAMGATRDLREDGGASIARRDVTPVLSATLVVS